MIFFRRVFGNSMLPTLKSGQIVLVLRSRKVKPGYVVVAYMRGREVVKRVKKLKNGYVYLEGDNQENSTDSKTLGPVLDTKIEGIVIWPRTTVKR